MKIADAEQAIREAARELSGLPTELASGVHAAAAGKAAHAVERRMNADNSISHASDVWSEMRATVTDSDALAALDGPIGQLQDAIVGIRAAIPHA